MKKQHLDYSRELANQCKTLIGFYDHPQIKNHPDFEKYSGMTLEEAKGSLENTISLHEKAVKFVLPDGGRIIDDRNLKALDDSEELKLPFKTIALEYSSTGWERDKKEVMPMMTPQGDVLNFSEDDSFVLAPKRLVYMQDLDENILLTVAFYSLDIKMWRILPDCLIPKKGYFGDVELHKGQRSFKIAMHPDVKATVSITDYLDEVAAALMFLNALRCSNVSIEKSIKKNRKVKRSKKKKLNPFPFDDYHFLEINVPSRNQASRGNGYGGSHRSPREHLRRGHIRTLQSGNRIWVNAAVVNAGNKGKIKKDYVVR